MKNDTSKNQKMLNTWAIAIIVWSMYRYYFKTDLPIWFDEFIAKPLVFLIPVYYYVIKYEKHLSFWKAVDFNITKVKDILFGLLAGVIILVTALGVFFVQTKTFFPPFSTSIFFYILVAFASSFSEEILSRGLVLKRLYEESKNVFTSVFFSSFLFFMMHVPILFSNPQIRGALLVQVMITDLLLSVGVSLAYLQKKNVLVAILIHAFYNLAIYLML